MNELTELALELQSFCQQRGWKFCLIGGLVVQHWGEPRFTKDVDMTLLTGFGNEETFVDEWLASYEGRLTDVRQFALTNRVLLLKSSRGIGIDIALGALPFEASAIARACDVVLESGAVLRLCSAEDLIVMKAFADRPQDRLDLRGILVRQGTGRLDWDYIKSNLAPLCEAKEDPDIMPRLEALRREVQQTEPA
jgi:predicted nucleotidyltransferase